MPTYPVMFIEKVSGNGMIIVYSLQWDWGLLRRSAPKVLDVRGLSTEIIS